MMGLNAIGEHLIHVVKVYEGSNGDATRALYDRLTALGPAGVIATNLFRACKTSERAKGYRRSSHRGASYDVKQWAMGNLATALTEHAAALGITWGWANDPQQAYHAIVLYVDLPTGQVSFHTNVRGVGPDYTKPWDGVRHVAPDRICRWCARLLNGAPNDA